MTLTREGEQTGTSQWAFVKLQPRFASSFICGVDARKLPSRNPTQSFKSSMAMNSTLSWFSDSALLASVANDPVNSVAMMAIPIHLFPASGGEQDLASLWAFEC